MSNGFEKRLNESFDKYLNKLQESSDDDYYDEMKQKYGAKVYRGNNEFIMNQKAKAIRKKAEKTGQLVIDDYDRELYNILRDEGMKPHPITKFIKANFANYDFKTKKIILKFLDEFLYFNKYGI